MLTLNDGRAELWQWDTGRTLSVDADCSQVHFSNKVFGRSIDVDVADGVAIIPDILLQTDNDLNVWAFVGTADNGYTKISKTFKVNRRNKPADYVFTPPDQTTLAELVGRLDKIEESQDPDAIKNAVNDYLEQNPVEAPVQSVNGQIGAVELTAKDVGAIAVETDPTVPAWAKADKKPEYSAEEVGAIAKTELQTVINTALEQAKASGEFDGADGKSAYQYAVESGYTGTETELAEKLASEAMIVTITDNNNTLSADKSFIEIRDAILDGIPVLVDNGGILFPYIAGSSELLIFGVTQCADTKVASTIIEITPNGEVNDISAQIDIPTALPNPNAITFTGAVEGSYDGSEPLTVEIPSGGGAGMGITGATVGQIAKIAAVDASGVPTAWSPVDMPSGGSSEDMRVIKTITITADGVNSIYFNRDDSGLPFALTKHIRIRMYGAATNTGSTQATLFFRAGQTAGDQQQSNYPIKVNSNNINYIFDFVWDLYSAINCWYGDFAHARAGASNLYRCVPSEGNNSSDITVREIKLVWSNASVFFQPGATIVVEGM